MKTVKKKQVQTEREIVLAVFCDFCAKDVKSQRTPELEKEIGENYDFDTDGNLWCDSTVHINMSAGWPDCSWSKTITLDVCAECFKKEIMSRARQFNEVNNDY